MGHGSSHSRDERDARRLGRMRISDGKPNQMFAEAIVSSEVAWLQYCRVAALQLFLF